MLPGCLCSLLVALTMMAIPVIAQDKDKAANNVRRKPKTSGHLMRLTKEQYSEMRSAFRPIMRENRELLPRLVQLAFHDCVGGCDGCLNLQDPNNFNLGTTLALAQQFRADHAPMLSQADVNVFISIRALSYAARQAYGRVRVPFSVGRLDCENPTAPPLRTFPHGRGLDSLEFLSGEFGTNRKESVALLGVHTLGRCNADVSGYRGPWDKSQEKLDNKYFQNMIKPGWFVEQRDKLPIVQSSQWSRDDADQSMMLHADMIMFKNFTTSGQFDTPSCQFNECPLSKTAHHVVEFANNQKKFHRTLREAFRKMVDGVGVSLQLVEDDGGDDDLL